MEDALIYIVAAVILFFLTWGWRSLRKDLVKKDGMFATWLKAGMGGRAIPLDTPADKDETPDVEAKEHEENKHQGGVGGGSPGGEGV